MAHSNVELNFRELHVSCTLKWVIHHFISSSLLSPTFRVLVVAKLPSSPSHAKAVEYQRECHWTLRRIHDGEHGSGVGGGRGVGSGRRP